MASAETGTVQMSNRSCTVIRFQPDGKCESFGLMHQFTDIPASPSAITDDAGNEYFCYAESPDLTHSIWHSHEKAAPKNLTLTFANGDTDTRPVRSLA
jgi:hypothetical protein